MNRIPADITSRIARLSNQADTSAVVSVLLDAKEEDTVRNEAANLLRRSKFRALTDDLVRILAAPDESARFRAFCIQHLWMNHRDAGPKERATIQSNLRQALSDSHTPVRREALLALVRMGDPIARETAIEWLIAGESDGIRDVAIHCAHQLDLRQHIPTIRRYLQDEDEAVRIAAIVALSTWGDGESRPAIEEAAAVGSYRLRRCAKMALKRLDAVDKGKPVVSGGRI